MVNRQNQTYTPNYLLDDICEAAKKGQLRYAGRKVNNDIRNLGYTGVDVGRCISLLTSKDFRKCLNYENASYDVYICDYKKHEESTADRIYMKLRLLTSGEIQVEIGSFHV